jgi:hypothetical protein
MEMKNALIVAAVLATSLLNGHAQTELTVSGGDMRDPLNWSAGLPTNGVVGTVGVDGTLADLGGDDAAQLVGWTIVQTNGTVTDEASSFSESEYRGVDLDIQTGGTWFRTGTVRVQDGSVINVSGGTMTMNNGMIAFPGGFKISVSSGSLISKKSTNYNSNDTTEKSITVTGGSAAIGVATDDTSKPIDEANVFFSVTDGSLAMSDLTYTAAAEATNIVVTIGDNAAFVTDNFDRNNNATALADRYIDFSTDDTTSSWQWVGKVEADFEALWSAGTLRRNGAYSGAFGDYFVVVGDTVSPAPPIASTDFTGGAADGELWATSANWSDGVPSASKIANINSNLTANLSGGSGNAERLIVGGIDGQSGGVTNGSLTVANSTQIATDTGSSGLVDLTAYNAGTSADDVQVGAANNATGNLVAGAGTLTGDNLSVGVGSGAIGTIDMGTGTLSFGNATEIGSGTSASGTVEAASFTLSGDVDLTIGSGSNAYGRVTASSGSVAVDNLTIAPDQDSDGTLDLGSGSATVSGQVSIGQGRDSTATLALGSVIVLDSTNGFFVGTGVGSANNVTASDFSVSGPLGNLGVGEGTDSSIKALINANDSIGSFWVNTAFALTGGIHDITALHIANQDDATASFSVSGATATFSGNIDIASGANTSYALDLADLLPGPHTAGAIDVARGDYSVASLVYTNDALFMTSHLEVGTGGDYSDGTVLLKSLEMDSAGDALSIAFQSTAVGSTGTVTILENADAGVVRVARDTGSVGTLTVGGDLFVRGLYLNSAGNLSNAVGVITADNIYKTNSLSGSIQVAQGDGTDGTITASGGEMGVNTFSVGSGVDSVGLFAVTNGMVSTKTVEVAIGNLSEATALVGITSIETNDVNIGTGSNAVGTLTLPSGTLAAANLNLGSANGGIGTLILAGGNLVVTGTVGGGNPTNSFINIVDNASLFTWSGKVQADFEALWNTGMLRSGGESGLTAASFSDYFQVSGDELSVVTVLPVGDLTITTDGIDISISWNTVLGQSYDLRADNNLAFATWAVYTNITGTGGEVTVDVPASNPAEFYKVTSD